MKATGMNPIRKPGPFLPRWVLTALTLGLPAATLFGQESPPAEAAPATQPVALDQLSVPALMDLANERSNAGDSTAALRALSAVLEREPTKIEAILRIAKIAEGSRDLETARRYFLAILKLEKHHFEANFGLGRFHSASQLWRQAVYYLEKAENLAPADRVGEVRAFLAAALRGHHQLPRALAVARRATEAAPHSFEARQTLTGILLEMNNVEQALEHSEHLVAIADKLRQQNPASAVGLQRLGFALQTRQAVMDDFYVSLNEIDEKGNRIDRLIPGKEQEAARILGQILGVMEELARINQILAYYEMLPLADKAVEFDPANLDRLQNLALLYRNTLQVDRAIETYQKMIALDPDHAGARQALQDLRAPLTSQPAQDADENATQPAPLEGE